MLDIQLDTRSELFDFYHDLALDVLEHTSDKTQVNAQIETAIRAWDGHMHTDSKGIALLIAFRTKLAEGVFAKAIGRCKQFDVDFRYAWHEMETPLRALLTQRPSGILAPEFHEDWNSFILQTLSNVSAELAVKHPDFPLDQLSWGAVNHISLAHPLSKGLPMLASFLNIDEYDSDGCAGYCVKVLSNFNGASERLVVSPAYPQDGILEMPGGQSGHPLSGYFRDQQSQWQQGARAAFLPGLTDTTWHFQP
jgi:penicillin amidase